MSTISQIKQGLDNPVITKQVNEREMLARLAEIDNGTDVFKLVFKASKNTGVKARINQSVDQIQAGIKRKKGGFKKASKQTEVIRKAVSSAVRDILKGETKVRYFSMYGGKDDQFGLNENQNYYVVDKMDNDQIKSFNPRNVKALVIDDTKLILV
jgi:hypothetical protein